MSKAVERGALQARTGRAERGQYILKLSMHASSMHHTKLGPRTGVRSYVLIVRGIRHPSIHETQSKST